MLGHGVNFPFTPLCKIDVACNLQCPNDGGNDEASCYRQFVPASIAWNLDKFLACELPHSSSNR